MDVPRVCDAIDVSLLYIVYSYSLVVQEQKDGALCCDCRNASSCIAVLQVC